MGRLINKWGRNYFKAQGKHIVETPHGGIYVYANKNDKEPEDHYKDWEEVASYHIPTWELAKLSKYKSRNHHLRKEK